MPEWYVNKPQMSFQLNLYVAIFMELSSCRSIGFGMGPIPWTAVNEYAKFLQLSPYQTRVFNVIINTADGVYLKHHSEKKE